MAIPRCVRSGPPSRLSTRRCHPDRYVDVEDGPVKIIEQHNIHTTFIDFASQTCATGRKAIAPRRWRRFIAATRSLPYLTSTFDSQKRMRTRPSRSQWISSAPLAPAPPPPLGLPTVAVWLPWTVSFGPLSTTTVRRSVSAPFAWDKSTWLRWLCNIHFYRCNASATCNSITPSPFDRH